MNFNQLNLLIINLIKITNTSCKNVIKNKYKFKILDILQKILLIDKRKLRFYVLIIQNEIFKMSLKYKEIK